MYGGEKTETTEPTTNQMSICLKYCIHNPQTQALMAKKSHNSFGQQSECQKMQQTNMLSFAHCIENHTAAAAGCDLS